MILKDADTIAPFEGVVECYENGVKNGREKIR